MLEWSNNLFKWIFKKDNFTVSGYIAFVFTFFILQFIHVHFLGNHKLLFFVCILFSLLPFRIIENVFSSILQDKNKEVHIGYGILLFALVTGISTFFFY